MCFSVKMSYWLESFWNNEFHFRITQKKLRIINMMVYINAQLNSSSFHLTNSKTCSPWPLPSILSYQPLFHPRLQRSPHCLLQSWFPQQQNPRNSCHCFTREWVQVTRDPLQKQQPRQNHWVTKQRFTGHHSWQHVSITPWYMSQNLRYHGAVHCS